MAHAHSNGVIHRDLKPSNILLDPNGRPRVADFGLAKRVQGVDELTRSGQIMGTPGYMPPEQAAGQHQKIGAQSDVYSLDVLYATLTGSPPFRGYNELELLRSTIEDLPIPPRNLVPSVDRDTETICLKCLEKQACDRYQSAMALADDLGRYLKGEPITARPRGYGRILWHWARRPQRTFECAGLVLIIATFFLSFVLVGLGTLLFQWVPTKSTIEAAGVVALDFTGFAFCLPVGIGILFARRWLILAGLLVGGAIVSIIVTFLWTGFEAGGLLSEPFHRFSIYTIFGFVGCLMIGVCSIALIAHRPRDTEVVTTSLGRVSSGSTKAGDDCPSTQSMNKLILEPDGSHASSSNRSDCRAPGN